MITGHTMVCGLIGDPVEHTSSPAIHNTLASIYGHDLVYVPFHVRNGYLEDAVRGAYALDIRGLNVTVPYKTDVMKYLCETDELAGRIGAVNTLVRTENGFKGYNTDILGLERALLMDGCDLAGRNTVILGAGGAARSAAFLCERMHAEKVYILNRSIDKAMAIADEVNTYAGRDLISAYHLDEYSRIEASDYVAIQATSVGLSPHDDEVVISDDAFYSRVTYGFDLVYRPAATKFMQLCNAHGARTSNGLVMLLYQGIIAYELWNGIKVSEDAAMDVLKVLTETVRS